MSGRPKIFNQEEVLQKAMMVFWKNGYEASSTEMLLEAMGIGKSSFYHSFKGGKQELFEKVLDYRSKETLERWNKELEATDDVMQFIYSLFMSVLSKKADRRLNGCLMGNTVAELSNIDIGLKEKATGLLHELEKLFLKALKKGRANGTITAPDNLNLLAKYLLNLWNGLNITVRMYDDPKVLKILVEKQLSILV